MIGSFLTKGLLLIFGYLYPAYECFKTLERNKPDINQYRFWCQYWILVALMTVFERVGDAFVSWVPMYSEAKLAFIIYLWCPRTKGTTYVYDSFFKPYISKHENEIDRNLLELRTRAGDMAYMYCQRAASFGQIRVFEILQYVAAQSTPRPRATQPQQPATRAQEHAAGAASVATNSAPASTAATSATAAAAAAAPQQHLTKVQVATQPQDKDPSSPTSSTSSSQDHKIEEEVSSSREASTSSAAPPSPAPTFIKKSVSLPVALAPESSSQSATDKPDAKQIVTMATKADKSPVKALPSAEETVMEETIRVTRGRLRKTRSTVAK